MTHLRSSILNKKEKLKKNQSQLESTSKYEDLQKYLLQKQLQEQISDKKIVQAEKQESELKHEIAVLEEKARLKEELMHFANEIDDDLSEHFKSWDNPDPDPNAVSSFAEDVVNDIPEDENASSNETGKKGLLKLQIGSE